MVAEEYRPNAELMVAVDGDDLPHAFLGTTGHHVDALFVHAGSQRMGLGRFLLDDFGTGKGIVTVDVNEQNCEAAGFYERLEFKRTGRSELDDKGRPYPILHMQWERTATT